MNPLPTRLDKLELENFRCFSKLEVDFNDKLTLIVAPNGGGKTALLEAACFGWKFFVQGIELNKTSKGFAEGDIRLALMNGGGMQPVKPVWLRAGSHVGNSPFGWTIHKGGKTPIRTSTTDAGDIKSEGNRLRLATQDHAEGKLTDSPVLPVLGYYGTGRLWAAQKITAKRRKQIKPDTSRTGGYNQCLSPNSHFGLFEVWFGRYSLEALQERSNNKPSSHRPSEKLQAVGSAVDALLKPTGWHSLSFDVSNEAIFAEHPIYGRIPVSMLSDGIRVMIGLVGDIAHRCARLNPHFGADAARLTPGVILIDEVDMHLHPEWQQLVLTVLRDAFPLVQFIVTTHSPQVVTTVKRENIRILVRHPDGSWSATPPAEETKYDKIMAFLAQNDGLSETATARKSGVSRSSVRLIKLGIHSLSPKSKFK